jgi:hypothetical protein
MKVAVIDAAARHDAVLAELAEHGRDVLQVPAAPVPAPTDHSAGFADPAGAAAVLAAVLRAGIDAVLVRSLAGVGIEVAEGLRAASVPYVVLIEDAWWLCEQRIMRRPAGRWCGQRSIDPLVCSTCVADHREHELRQRRGAAVLGAAAAVVVPGEFWADQLTAAGVPAERIVLAEPALRPGPGAGPRPGPTPWLGPVRFGFLGTGDADRADHLVAAFAALPRTDFEFIASGQRRTADGRLVLSRRDFPKAFLVRESGVADLAYCDAIDVLVVPAEWPGASAAAARSALAGGVHILGTTTGPVAELLRARPELAPNCTLVPPGPAGLRTGIDDLIDRGQGRHHPAPAFPAGASVPAAARAAVWAAAHR